MIIVILLSCGVGSYFYQKNIFSKAYDFKLVSPTGPVSLSDFRGKVVFLYFGFLSCPEACPNTLKKFSIALRRFDSKLWDQVKLLMIDLDPQRDSMEKLIAYTSFFHPQITPLTGDIGEIKKIADFYGASFQKVNVSSALDYTIDHTTELLLIDKEGRILQSLDEKITVDELEKHIKQLISN